MRRDVFHVLSRERLKKLERQVSQLEERESRLEERQSRLAERVTQLELASLIDRLKPLDTGVDLIRLGPEHDGGYLIPDDLEGITFCLSPGVGTGLYFEDLPQGLQSNFEFALAERGIKVFMADKSVDGPARLHKNFSFEKTFLAARSNTKAGETTLDDWYRRTVGDSEGDGILQMDIEGAEYDVIPTISDHVLSQLRIIVIEFHDLERLFDDTATSAKMKQTFEMVLKTHAVAHIHPNNHDIVYSRGGIDIPQLLEFTFYRRDRFAGTPPLMFPHPLDRKNAPSRDDVILPPCWQP